MKFEFEIEFEIHPAAVTAVAAASVAGLLLWLASREDSNGAKRSLLRRAA